MTSTFFVLPARDILGRQFAGFLTGLFPGLDWTATSPVELADTLTCLAEARDDVFVIHRDELVENDDLELTLARTYGAEKGDLIVEVADAVDTPPAPAKVWRITTEIELDDEDFADESDEWEEDEAIAAGAEDS